MASFAVEVNDDFTLNHEDSKWARAVTRSLQLKTKTAKYKDAQSCKLAQKEARRNKPSHVSSAVAACERVNPHRATRVAKRTCLSQGKIEAEADMPTWSRGLIGIRKPSVSASLRFSSSSDEVVEAAQTQRQRVPNRYAALADDNASQPGPMVLDDSKFGSHVWIEDAETTAADVTDSAAENSDSHDSDEVPEPENVDSFPPLAQVAAKEIDRETQDLGIVCDEENQVEKEVSVTKAVGEAVACADAETILAAAKVQAESEARAIRAQALADACALKARVESQAQAKAEATLAQMRASVEKKQTPKKPMGFKDAKEMDQQRARRQCKQTREERTFQQGLELMRAQVEAECREVKEKALAEANAAKTRAVAEARAIRAKARSSAKLEEQRRRGATEVIAVLEDREDTEVVQENEPQLELTSTRSELERKLVDAPSAVVAADADSEFVNSSQASVNVTQDAVLPLEVDAEWEILPDSSLETIPGWDVIV